MLTMRSDRKKLAHLVEGDGLKRRFVAIVDGPVEVAASKYGSRAFDVYVDVNRALASSYLIPGSPAAVDVTSDGRIGTVVVPGLQGVEQIMHEVGTERVS
jgi:hypothetical protein